VKIRIKDNSIRLRLTRGEVDTMRDSGVVTSKTGFPGGREFCYTLESSPASVNPAAFYLDNEIRLRLPEAVILAWTTTEQVSIKGDHILDDGETLSILIEKDFACLAPRSGEDEADMYPHPNVE
jgi:hypothetical protein|tara:strand:- start:920 stop:1291 length:372 start_codon:yes stop_codon:yes gene_type:complete